MPKSEPFSTKEPRLRSDVAEELVWLKLAHELGVPRRTVFHAFRRSLGLGPYCYFELKRLYQLRRQLRHAVYGEVTVTEIASMFGLQRYGTAGGQVPQRLR